MCVTVATDRIIIIASDNHYRTSCVNNIYIIIIINSVACVNKNINSKRLLIKMPAEPPEIMRLLHEVSKTQNELETDFKQMVRCRTFQQVKITSCA